MKIKKLLSLMFVTVMGAGLMVGCGSTPQPPKEEKITLNKTSATMDLFDTLQLEATLENVEGNVTWSSDATNVVTVDNNGLVKSVANGSAVVTASISKVKATCAITVDSEGEEPLLTLNVDELSIHPTEEFTLTPVYSYGEKTLDATFAFESNTPDVATVSNSGKVVGVSCGEAVVKVTATYLTFTDFVELDVKVVPDVSISLDEEEVILGSVETEELKTSKKLTATVKSGEDPVVDPEIVWDVEDDKVATVLNGVVTAQCAGETVVSATYNYQNKYDVTAYATVTVIKPTVDADLENDEIDFDAFEGDKAEIILSDLGQPLAELEKIYDVSNVEEVEVPFEIVQDKVMLPKAYFSAGEKTLLIDYKKVTFEVTVRILCSISSIVEFNSEADLANVAIYWPDPVKMSFSSDVKKDGENGSLKLTYAAPQGWDYLVLNNLITSDVSDFDFIEFSVYNPTSHTFVIQPTWADGPTVGANGWTDIKFKVSDIKANKIKNMSDIVIPATDITGYPICFYGDGFVADECFYISNIKATKNVVPPVLEDVVLQPFATEQGTLNLNIFNDAATVEFDSSVKYAEEAGSAKVTAVNTAAAWGETYIALLAPSVTDISEYGYISFRVHNDTDHDFSTGVLWAKDTLVPAGEWAEVVITVEEFDGLGIQNLAGTDLEKTDITGLAIRLMGGWVDGDVCHISNVMLYKNPAPLEDKVLQPFATEEGTQNLNVFNDAATVAFDSTVKYGDEAGSAKFTCTAGSDTGIALLAPSVTDISKYDHISFRVYNDNDHAIQTGIYWAKDTTIQPGEWGEITISVEEFDTINATNIAGTKLYKTDITGLVIRLMGGWTVGDVCHISNVVLYA